MTSAGVARKAFNPAAKSLGFVRENEPGIPHALSASETGWRVICATSIWPLGEFRLLNLHPNS